MEGSGEDLHRRVEEAGSRLSGASPLPEVAWGFSVQGAGTSPGRVVRVRVREGLSEVYEARVDLAYDDLGADPDELLGCRGALTITRGPLTRTVAGVVRRVEHLGRAGGSALARVTVVPSLWTLSQRVDTRIFQNLTALQVVQAVLRGARVYDGKLDVQVRGAMLPREYCVQHHETDLAFVRRLLEEEGVTFFFRHAPGGETLVLTDHGGAYGQVATLDGGAVPIDDAQAGTLPVESVRTFERVRRMKPTRTTVRDYDFTRPDLDLTRDAPGAEGDRAQYVPNAEVVLAQYGAPVYTAENAASQASLRQEAHTGRVERARGRGSVTGITPGFTFALFGDGAAGADPRYVVTRVEHMGEAPDALLYDTQHTGPTRERYANRFTCVPVSAVVRPARVTPRPRVEGIQTAEVVGPAGEEIYTDEHGRIKVQFHWDRLGSRNEQSSCWMRVVQGPWSGSGWGFQFIPRVGMEVVVSFIEGNPDRPVVTGALYNGRNRPPYPLPDGKAITALKTQSTPGGGGSNELRFTDTAGREEVYLHAQQDYNAATERDASARVGRHEVASVGVNRSASVGNNETASVGNDQSLSVGNNQSLDVGNDQTVHVAANQTLSVDADQAVTVGGNRTQSVTGDESLTVSGSQTESVTGNRTATITGNDALTIAGSRTLSVTGDQGLSIQGAQSTAVQGAQTVAVTGIQATTVLGGRSVTVIGGQSSNVTGAETRTIIGPLTETVVGPLTQSAVGPLSVTSPAPVSVTSGATLLLQAASEGVLQGASVSVTASGELVLSGGGAVIRLSGGGVEINGSQVKIAGGAVDITGGIVKIN
jgi:type VI secretion system secreted protein VgrG